MQKISTPFYIFTVLLLVFGGLLCNLLLADQALPNWLTQTDRSIYRVFHQDGAGNKDELLYSLVNQWWFILILFGAVIGLSAHRRRRLAWLLYFTGLTLLSAHLIDGVLLRHLFDHYRPYFDPALAGIHYQEQLKATLYGFGSAHTADAFAVSLFLFLMIRKYRLLIGPILLLWASLVAVSTLDSGRHYPSDIIIGLCTGLLIGFLFYFLYDHLFPTHKITAHELYSEL